VNIHAFKVSPHGLPNAPPAVDSSGNAYGTTYSGGSKKLGSVWKLIPVTTGEKAGTYEEKILHAFTAEKTGEGPGGGVLIDSSGNI
jgi:hypothetical protein